MLFSPHEKSIGHFSVLQWSHSSISQYSSFLTVGKLLPFFLLYDIFLVLLPALLIFFLSFHCELLSSLFHWTLLVPMTLFHWVLVCFLIYCYLLCDPIYCHIFNQDHMLVTFISIYWTLIWYLYFIFFYKTNRWTYISGCSPGTSCSPSLPHLNLQNYTTWISSHMLALPTTLLCKI